MGVVLPTIGQHNGAPPRDFAICSGMTPGLGIFSPTLPYGLDIPMSVLMTQYVQIYVSSLHPSLNSFLLSQLVNVVNIWAIKTQNMSHLFYVPQSISFCILFLEDITNIRQLFSVPKASSLDQDSCS